MTFPIQILSLPNRVEIAKDRGWCCTQQAVHLYVPEDQNFAFITFLHEATHAIGGMHGLYETNPGWPRIRQYILKEKFINYVQTYLNCIDLSLRNWLLLPKLSDAADFKDHQWLLSLTGQTKVEEYEKASVDIISSADLETQRSPFVLKEGFMLDLSLVLQRVRFESFSKLPFNHYLDDIAQDFNPEKPLRSEILKERELLKDYGCTDLGQYEIFQKSTGRIYKLPDNPHKLDKTNLLIHLDRPLKDNIHGCVVSLPRDQFDEKLSEEQRQNLSHWQFEGGGETGYYIYKFNFASSKKDLLNFNIRISSLDSLSYYTNSFDYIAVDKKSGLGSFEVYSLNNEYWNPKVAQAQVVQSGDIKDKTTTSGDVVWIEDENNYMHYYHLPKGLQADKSVIELVELHDGFLGGAAILKKRSDIDKWEYMLLPEGTLDLYDEFNIKNKTGNVYSLRQSVSYRSLPLEITLGLDNFRAIFL